MIPWVVVALLGGFALGGLLRRAHQWRWSSQTWQAEAADAYREVAFLAERNEELHKAVDAAFDAGYDQGFQNGVGIRVDLGGIEP
jgi:hypothetical protein